MNVSEDLINFFKTLGESTRLNIIYFISDGEKSAQEIQKGLNKSQSIISQRLKNLTDSDILSVRRERHQKYYKIKYPQLLDIISGAKKLILQKKKAVLDKLTNELKRKT